MSGNRGFALVTVLCVLMIVSGVALALAAGMRSQVLAAANDRGGLEAEQLCSAAQEMAVYLGSRNLGTPVENLEGLPVEAIRPGFQYLIHFPNGDVDLFLDAEDGKLNLSTARPEVLQSFFASWADDSTRGSQLVAAMKDWRDPDDDPEPGGAESAAYSSRGYTPRNGGFGAADAPLLMGLGFEDFRESLVERQGQWVRREALTRFLTGAAVGATVNPFYAPELVLRAMPGLSNFYVDKILQERRRGPFKDLVDFSQRVGMPPDTQMLALFHFSRKVPAFFAMARSRDRRVLRSERRVDDPFFTIQFNVFPDYIPALP